MISSRPGTPTAGLVALEESWLGSAEFPLPRSLSRQFSSVRRALQALPDSDALQWQGSDSGSSDSLSSGVASPERNTGKSAVPTDGSMADDTASLLGAGTVADPTTEAEAVTLVTEPAMMAIRQQPDLQLTTPFQTLGKPPLLQAPGRERAPRGPLPEASSTADVLDPVPGYVIPGPQQSRDHAGIRISPEGGSRVLHATSHSPLLDGQRASDPAGGPPVGDWSLPFTLQDGGQGPAPGLGMRAISLDTSEHMTDFAVASDQASLAVQAGRSGTVAAAWSDASLEQSSDGSSLAAAHTPDTPGPSTCGLPTQTAIEAAAMPTDSSGRLGPLVGASIALKLPSAEASYMPVQLQTARSPAVPVLATSRAPIVKPAFAPGALLGSPTASGGASPQLLHGGGTAALGPVLFSPRNHRLAALSQQRTAMVASLHSSSRLLTHSSSSDAYMHSQRHAAAAAIASATDPAPLQLQMHPLRQMQSLPELGIKAEGSPPLLPSLPLMSEKSQDRFSPHRHAAVVNAGLRLAPLLVVQPAGVKQGL